MFGNPVYSWKNLTYNPNVTIRSDIVKVLETLPRLKSVVEKLKSHGTSLVSAVNKISSLDIKIKGKENELKKAKIEKKRQRLDKELKSLLAKKESVIKKHKGIEADYIKNAADTYIEFDDLVTVFFRLNVMVLTLVHRARRDIDDLISKIISLKHDNLVELEKMKAEAVAELNKEKLHLKDLCKELYHSSEFQERGKFNPAELTHEMSFQGIPIKCRRVKQLTIEIDNIEGRIDHMSGNLRLNEVSSFARSELASQIADFKYLAHHIKILTHRFGEVLHHYPENKKLKKKSHGRLRDIVRQSRLLWNSIHIQAYHAKVVRMPKQK